MLLDLWPLLDSAPSALAAAVTALPIGLAYVPDHVPNDWLTDEEEALLSVLLATAL